MDGWPIEGAERLHDPADVEAAFDRMAADIDARFAGEGGVALCMLQGGIIPTGLLLTRVRAPLELDSIHVTRYRNTTVGGEIEWRARPRIVLAGRRVLVIDDILDEGHSLAAIRAWLSARDAAEVLIAVLVEKRHERRAPGIAADFRGLEVPDRYVFGYGMDVRGWHRNAAGIFALAEH